MYLEGGNFYIFFITGFSLKNTPKLGHFLVRKRILTKMKSCHPLNMLRGTVKYIFMLSIPKCKFLKGFPYTFHPNIPPYNICIGSGFELLPMQVTTQLLIV